MTCLSAESERNQHQRTRIGWIAKVIRRPLAVVNHCVAGIKTRHNALGRVEFENAAEVNCKVGKTMALKLKREIEIGQRGAGLNIFRIALTKTYDPRPGLCEYAPFLKALA